MAELHVALEEGFSGDGVTVRVAGRKAFEADALRTRMQLGLAESFTVDVPDGDVDVTLEVPHRTIVHRQQVLVAGTTYLGFSLGQGGEVEVRTSTEPFGYV